MFLAQVATQHPIGLIPIPVFAIRSTIVRQMVIEMQPQTNVSLAQRIALHANGMTPTTQIKTTSHAQAAIVHLF